MLFWCYLMLTIEVNLQPAVEFTLLGSRNFFGLLPLLINSSPAFPLEGSLRWHDSSWNLWCLKLMSSSSFKDMFFWILMINPFPCSSSSKKLPKCIYFATLFLFLCHIISEFTPLFHSHCFLTLHVSWNTAKSFRAHISSATPPAYAATV